MGHTMAVSVADKVLNSCLVFNPQGVRVARYDKIHLFGFQKGEERYNESATIEPGRLPVTFDTPFGRVGLSICYDLRFPELFRALGAVDLLEIAGIDGLYFGHLLFPFFSCDPSSGDVRGFANTSTCRSSR